MHSLKIKILTIAPLLLSLCCWLPCGAQNASSPSDNYVTSTGFKNRVFEVKNRLPEDLVPVIRLLISGFKGAQLSASNEFRTITVRDFPENIAAIEDAIKRLDTSEVSRPDIELRMHVLLASNKEGGANLYPDELKDVIKELHSTLSFKDYTLVTSIVQRTRESPGPRSSYLDGRGSAEVAGPSSAQAGANDKRQSNYRYQASSVAISSNSAGAMEIQLGDFTFSLDGPGTVSMIHSDVKLRDGENVVVGTAGYNDKALILVMTARILK